MPDESSEPVIEDQHEEKKEEVKEYKFIRWDDSGVVAHLTMNRPKQNIFNIEMLREIAQAVESLSAREDVRLILLDSAPECDGYFSAGGGAETYRSEMVFQMMDVFHSVFRAMIEVSKPVVAVVDGIAQGAGAELATFCDLVVATERAQFRQPEIKFGVFPPLGAVVYPRVVGPRRAMELLLTGEAINAQQAVQMGLVNRVVPRTALKETVEGLVKRISEQSAPVLKLLKQVVFEGTWRPFNEALKKAQDIYLNQLFGLEDSQEYLRAMAEKRKPVWKNK